MKFSHPLARRGKMWQLESVDGRTRAASVIETTLELDPSHEDYSAEKIAKLPSAARERLRELLPSIDEILRMTPLLNKR